MNKEELYIITDNSREQLDLLSPSGITLKWVSNLFNDISKLTCSYSYTFKLPMTANNRRVLELADDIRHENNMMKKAFRAEFFVNGINLCPNANVYISEMTNSFSCVMTWKVLKGFETLKSDGCKLNELPSLGKIQWGGDEQYGGTDNDTSNIDSVVYPDYDAGVPHMKNTPPKPCVPVYKLIQMINEYFGVKFNIGQLMKDGMGMKPRRFLNNANYYGRRVYDDFVSNGVIPLVNSQISNDRFAIRGMFGIGTHNMVYKYMTAIEKWSMAEYGSGSSSNPIYAMFYEVTEGTYTSLSPVVTSQLNAEYNEPTLIAVGIPVFDTFRGNDYVKPLYCFQHNSGLWFFNAKKGQKADVDAGIASQYGRKPSRWGSRTYEITERIIDSLGTTPQSKWGDQYSAKCTENNTRWNVYSNDQGPESGTNIGVIGFYTRNACTVKGSCDLRIAKSAVTEGRVSIDTYKWICIASVGMKKKDDSDEIEFNIEPVTEKSISSAAGFQSIDVPKYDEATDSYVCHFEFGSEYDVRKIEIDANDEEDFSGYIFLPYFPEDHTIEVDVTDTDGNTEKVSKLNLQEGDFVIDNIVITEVMPNIDVSVLPATMRITESLPEISCFDFMKSVFYMNGAMPRVERDGETITAMYYNQLRDRVNDGDVLDWSKKILSADKDLANASKFHNTNFAKNNYFEMNKSNRGKTDEEILDEFDQYGNGYGNIVIDDDTLKDELSVFSSPFAPAFIQNLRYPIVKVGNTCKVWEGDDVMESNVPAIYGYMVYRTYDPSFEDTRVQRPQNSDITTMHKRMNIFSPFDDEEMMENFFGYLKSILNDYQLVKEKFLLDEIDLRDFDESKPVYLNKYNAYFAVSSIQRDKDGISTVELLKLPRVYDSIKEINNSYSVEMLSTDTMEAKGTTGSDSNYKIYIKRTKDSEWEEVSTCVLEFGSEGIYAIAGESDKPLYIYCNAIGKYRFSYRDVDTDTDKSFIKSEVSILFDGKQWTDCVAEGYEGQKLNYVIINQDDPAWHRVEMAIPIRNQFDEVVETRRWISPILVTNKESLEGYDENGIKTIVTVGSVGRFYIYYERNYTSNQPAISTDNGTEGWYDGNCSIYKDSPNWARPYDIEYLKGDTYKLTHYTSNTVSYTVVKYKDGVKISEKNFTEKLRAYYDDERVVENKTFDYSRSEFGKWHVWKYEFDIKDIDGTIIEKVHKRLIWFVSDVVQSALDQPYGQEHDDEAVVKHNKVTIIGSATLIDKQDHSYTLTYEPSYADIKASSVRVYVEGSSNSNISVVSQQLDGFVLRALNLPDEESQTSVYVDVTLEDGSLIKESKMVSIVMPIIKVLEDGESIEALNGTGSKVFHAVILPGNIVINEGEITSINASSSKVTATILSGWQSFQLDVNGVTEDMSVTINITAIYNGVEIQKQFFVNIMYKDTWSTDYLDSHKALIVDRNGTFYSESEWKASGIENDDADGVAVSDGTHRFVISKKEDSPSYGGGDDNFWSKKFTSTIIKVSDTSFVEEKSGLLITGIKTTTDANDAMTDFLGKDNTDKIIEQDPNNPPYTSSAAEIAKQVSKGTLENYFFFGGKPSYLGAAGEWALVESIVSQVNSLLKAIGSQELSGSYWTSTQRTDAMAWSFGIGNSSPSATDKNSRLNVRAFAGLTILEQSVKRGNVSIIGPDSFTAVNKKGEQLYTVQYDPSGCTVEEVSVSIDNPDVKIELVNNTTINISVNGLQIDEVATFKVRARVNGLMETASKTIIVIGETVVDFAKLDAAHALIIDTDYNLYDEDEWYASNKLTSDVNGIAVSDGTHRFVIAKNDVEGGRYKWGGRGVTIPDLSSGFAGYENTLKIIETVTSSDGYFTSSPYSAAAVAHNFVFPNGELGFLGSSSEWQLVLDNIDKIEALLAAAGGDSLIKTYSYTYWTSYSPDESRAYCVHCYRSSTDGSVNTGLESYRYRQDSADLRPFHNF